MISINDDVSFFLCDKPVVKKGRDVPPRKLRSKLSTFSDTKLVAKTDERCFMVLFFFFRCSQKYQNSFSLLPLPRSGICNHYRDNPERIEIVSVSRDSR